MDRGISAFAVTGTRVGPAGVCGRFKTESRVESDRDEPGCLPDLLPSAGHRLLDQADSTPRPPHHEPWSALLFRLPPPPSRSTPRSPARTA